MTKQGRRGPGLQLGQGVGRGAARRTGMRAYYLLKLYPLHTACACVCLMSKWASSYCKDFLTQFMLEKNEKWVFSQWKMKSQKKWLEAPKDREMEIDGIETSIEKHSFWECYLRKNILTSTRRVGRIWKPSGQEARLGFGFHNLLLPPSNRTVKG